MSRVIFDAKTARFARLVSHPRRDRDASLAEDAGTAAEPRSGGSPGPEGIAKGEVA